MNVAIIPARGGSKRIPGKNVRDFRGKPIIAYSIRAALDTGLFARVIVSTDDDRIAEVAKAHGAEAPFRRPADLSGDHVATAPVIAHAIRWLEDADETVDLACCIYATAPFVRAADITAAHARFAAAPDKAFAFSATSYGFPIQRALRVTDDGVAMFQPEHALTRSQDLEPAYHDAGQFYWGRRDAWLNGLPIFAPHSLAQILPRWRVQDIDEEEDWARAEAMYAAIAGQ